MHHLRSSNISLINKELQNHWDLEKNIRIPTHEIIYGGENEVARCVPTQFLIDQIPSSSQSPKTMQINSNVNSVDSIESEDEDVEIDFMYGNEGDLKGNEEDFK